MSKLSMDMELSVVYSRHVECQRLNENFQLAFVEAGGGVILLTWRSGLAEVQEQALAALGNLGAVGEPAKNR
jgi:hypothetical protein